MNKGKEYNIFCNLPVHAGKTQISLGIRAVWSEPSLAAWTFLSYPQSASRKSGLASRMRSLIWVFAVRTI